MNVAHSLPFPDYEDDQSQSSAGIWLALAFALLLHILFVLLPVLSRPDANPPPSKNIEIEVSRYTEEPVAVPLPEPPPQPTVEKITEPDPSPVETPQTQAAKKVPQATATTAEDRTSTNPEELNPLPVPLPDQVPETDVQLHQRLSPGILSSQFITTESVTDKIFGPAQQQDPQPVNKAFQFPHKPNMMTMLDKPVSDLPFAYTPGIIEFAYDPGVKGDFQRFFDKITPEFGWKNNYGTQYKCKWILVIAACGWGRIKDHVKGGSDYFKQDQPEPSH